MGTLIPGTNTPQKTIGDAATAKNHRAGALARHVGKRPRSQGLSAASYFFFFLIAGLLAGAAWFFAEYLDEGDRLRDLQAKQRELEAEERKLIEENAVISEFNESFVKKKGEFFMRVLREQTGFASPGEVILDVKAR